MGMVSTLSPKFLSSPNMLKLTRALSWSLEFISIIQRNQQHPAGVSRWLGDGACLHSSWLSATDTCSVGPPYIKSLVVFWVGFYPLKRLIMLFFLFFPSFADWLLLLLSFSVWRWLIAVSMVIMSSSWEWSSGESPPED